VSDRDLRAGIEQLLAKRPRLTGLLLVLLSGVMIAWNNYFESAERALPGYYPAAYVFGYPAVFLGTWLVITGRSGRDDRPLKTWWVVGIVVGMLVSLAYGIVCMRRAHP